MKTIKRIASMVMIASLAIVAMSSCKDGGEKTTPTDYTVVNTLITEIEATLSTATTENYPQSAITALTTVLNSAKAAVQTGKLTQSQVDALVTTLQKANDIFKAASYLSIPETAVVISLNFDGEEPDAITTAGTKNLTATLMAGPSEIFGVDTKKPTYVAGVTGKAMHFEKGSHLAIADYASADFLKNTMSFTAWVKPAELRAGNIIMSLNYWHNWKFQIQDGGKAFFTLTTTAGGNDMDNEIDNSVTVGVWKHVVVSVDLSAHTVAIYVDGELTKLWNSEGKPNLSGTVAAAYTGNVGTLPLMIGTNTTYAEALDAWTWGEDWKTPANWDYFHGDMDNVAIYNVALSSGQVAKLYNDQKAK